jgi:hypothetical protein
MNRKNFLYIAIIEMYNISFRTSKKRKPCPYAETNKTSNLILRPCERKAKYLCNES